MKRTLVGALALCCAINSSSLRAFECEGVETAPGTAITLELVSQSLSAPVDVTHAPGDTDRIFVLEQSGRIRIIRLEGDTLVAQPYLDIRSQVSCCGERGLLGLAFHPNYAENGYFYVYYTRREGAVCRNSPVPGCLNDSSVETVISRFQVSDNPDVADAASEMELLSFCQPFSNHNGGQLQFSPNDGYLYIATGDGGSGGDPCGSSQNNRSFLGKILRLDVDGAEPYAIPASNPFAEQDDSFPEIWALGLRNPWRFSFDPDNGDMYIADVGQNVWEEISFQPGDSEGGLNYEWRRREGDHSFSQSDYGPGVITGPILEYRHGGGFLRGCSITGGVVYRGCKMPDLRGEYFFSDYCNNWVASFRYVDGVVTETRDRTAELNVGIAPDQVDGVSAFGVDAMGEMYVCDLGSKLFRIVPTSPPGNVAPTARIDTVPADGRVILEEAEARIVLDGSASDDGENGQQGLTFAWSRVDGPEDVDIVSADTESTEVILRELGVYTFRLTVDDGEDEHSVDVAVEVIVPPAPMFLRSDTNADGVLDISDGVYDLLFLFAEGATPPCFDAADADDNGQLELTDAIYKFNFLFLGGRPPAPPAFECGPDEGDDALDCEFFPPCA